MLEVKFPRGDFDKFRTNGRGHIENHNHTVELSQVEVEVEASNTLGIKVETMKTQNASEKLETKLRSKKKSKHYIMHWLINIIIVVTLLEIGNDSSVNIIDAADSNSTGGISSNDNNYFARKASASK